MTTKRRSSSVHFRRFSNHGMHGYGLGLPVGLAGLSWVKWESEECNSVTITVIICFLIVIARHEMKF